MRVGAIVIMATSVACVCEPAGARSGSIGAAAGMATIFLQQPQADDDDDDDDDR